MQFQAQTGQKNVSQGCDGIKTSPSLSFYVEVLLWKNHALRGGNREAKVPDGRSLQDCNGTVGPAWLKMRAASATCILKDLQRAGVKHKKNRVRHASCGCEAGDAHVCGAVTWLRCVVCGADGRVGSLNLNTSCIT